MPKESVPAGQRSTFPQTRVPPLRAVREAQGLTLAEVARTARVTPSFLSRVERGEKQLSVDTLARVAKAIGLNELAKMLAPYRTAS